MIPAVSAATGGGATGLPYQWVATGISGELYTSTSTTASTWTSRTSSFGTSRINWVASNGTSLYVAVGETGKLGTSPDGITWTQQTSSFSLSDIYGIAYGSDGYWVACGDGGKVAYSTNGTSWTQKATGISGVVHCVAYGNGLWIIGNDSGSFYTATNPTGTWTSRTSTLTNTTIGCGIHYAKSLAIWIAGCDGGTTGALASSTDGLTWTARDSAFSIGLAAGVGISSNTTVAVAAGIKTLVPAVYDVESSTNGTTWTDRSPANTTAANNRIACDNSGMFCWIGGNAQTSTDGVNWTDRGVIDSNVKTGICHSSGTPSIR